METLYTCNINRRPGKSVWTVLAAISLAMTGCLMAPPTDVPMASLPIVDADPDNRSLIVMLPGRGDRAHSFESSGFLDACDHWNFDVLAADAHFGYYFERDLVPRLHEDIILPAKASGYDNIWLLGVSIGGFGSLLYAAEYSENIQGVILLAPFLGDPDVARSIDDAGGLHAWSGDRLDDAEDYEIEIWSWLKGASNGSNESQLILGYGRSDRLAESYGPLIEALAPSQVYAIDGGHKWTTWGPLWSQIAADLEL